MIAPLSRPSKPRFFVSFLALIGAVAGGFSPEARAATLIHSNDVMGDIEPCGCRSNPQGGLARKANLIRKLGDPSVLQLDAGDLLFSTDTVPELLSKQAELQAGYLLKAMAALRHDAVVPGEKDFALGFKKFERLTRRSPIKFLAANLVRRDGKKAFDPSAVFTRKDSDGKALRIAVIGLYGEDLPLPGELKAKPALAAARSEVRALRKRADLVILLTHQGLDRDKELAEKVPGIDIIVGGHSQSFLQEPLKIGSTLIYQSSFRNQYVGTVPLKKPFTGEGYNLVGLDAGYESPAEAPGKVDDLVKEFKTAVAELNSREEAHLAANAVPSSGQGSTTAKFQTFGKCAECHLKQFEFWRKTPHTLALSSLIEKKQEKNKECLTCHTVGLGDPQGFQSVLRLAEIKPAAKAGASDSASEPVPEAVAPERFADYLKALHDAKSLDSEVRHPASDRIEPLRRSLNSLHRTWTPVQCENCHQPGRDHPFSGVYSKKVENSSCLKCHTAERAPGWYTKAGKLDENIMAAKRKLMTCPAGELTESE